MFAVWNYYAALRYNLIPAFQMKAISLKQSLHHGKYFLLILSGNRRELCRQ